MPIANDNFRIAILRTTHNAYSFIAGISRETTDGYVSSSEWKSSRSRDIVDIERESREKKLERSGRRPSGASVCFSHRKKRKKWRKKTVVGGGSGGRVTVVSHFREILNCELRERGERG